MQSNGRSVESADCTNNARVIANGSQCPPLQPSPALPNISAFLRPLAEYQSTATNSTCQEEKAPKEPDVTIVYQQQDPENHLKDVVMKPNVRGDGGHNGTESYASKDNLNNISNEAQNELPQHQNSFNLALQRTVQDTLETTSLSTSSSSAGHIPPSGNTTESNNAGTEQRTFPCKTCWKIFPDSFGLVEHILKYCTVKVMSESHGRNDTEVIEISSPDSQESDHDDKNMFQCNVCHEKFTSELLFRQHMRQYSSGKSYKCDACAKTFLTKWAFTLHMQQHKNPTMETNDFTTSDGIPISEWRLRSYVLKLPEKAHQCTFCGEAFTRKNELLLHEQIHRLPEERYHCRVCDQKFKRKSSYENHMSSRHRVTVKCFCSSCNTFFRNQYRYAEHLKQCLSNGKEEVYECRECGVQFLQQKWLDEHSKVHTPLLTMQDGLPMRTTHRQQNKGPTETRLYAMTEYTPRSHQCDLCGLKFLREASLVLHKRNHVLSDRLRSTALTPSGGGKLLLQAGEEPPAAEAEDKVEQYKCTVCDKTFASPELERLHLCRYFEEKYLAMGALSPTASSATIPYGDDSYEHRDDDSNDNNDPYDGLDHNNSFQNTCGLSRNSTDAASEHTCLITKRGKSPTLKSKSRFSFDSGKNYSCDHCYKSFRVKSQLIRHLYMANGENQRRCGRCRKSFFTTLKYCKHPR